MSIFSSNALPPQPPTSTSGALSVRRTRGPRDIADTLPPGLPGVDCSADESSTFSAPPAQTTHMPRQSP
eukprot:31595-Eustigmatos_ZCMA.PRE.1